MPLLKKDASALLRGLRTELKARIRSQADLIFAFVKEDDWSFVIKVHALIEASISELVLANIGDTRLRPVIERLQLANEATGKLALADALDLLDNKQRAFIRRLSQLRNRLVHDVRQTSFNFQEYTKSLAAGDVNSWQDNVVWFPVEGSARDIWRQIALDNPKVAVCFAALMLGVDMAIDDTGATTLRKLREFALRTGEELLRDFTRELPS